MGDKPSRYRLKLKRLDFISAVDAGAQGPIANVALIKRADPGGFEATFRVAKTDESLGLVFGWAMAGTLDGGKTPHVDLQDDAIDVNSDEFLKACAEFMEGGAAADVMHDGEQDGRVVFAFPLIPEINKALGIETETHGLAIAMKPSTETFKRFQSGELAAFSIGGVGERTPLDKGAARKSADKRYLTDEVAGHQHEVCVYDGGTPWMTDATAAGAASRHSHTVTRDESGALLVLADSGHTHTLTEVPKVISVDPDTVVVTEEKRSPTTIVNVTNNATTKSPRIGTDSKVVIKMNELEEFKTKLAEALARIATLEEQLGAAKAEAELTDEEKAHAAKLDVTEQKRFKALSKSDRKSEVAKALEADPVVCVFEGTAYRKSNPMAPMAKRLTEQAETIEKARIVEIAKAKVGRFPGKLEVHEYLIKSVLNGGGSKELVDATLESLGGSNEMWAEKAKAPGFSGTAPTNGTASPMEALTKGLQTFCAANNVPVNKMWTEGYPKFTATDEGAALKRAVDEQVA